MQPVIMKSSSGGARRDVETAIMETETRTELSVEYSVPSVNMNIQTEGLLDAAPSMVPVNNSRTLDKTHYGKILQKLYFARRILNPVIDEIITTASTISETELSVSANVPLCSLSKQEYRGALRASQIFREVNEELVHKYNKIPFIAENHFRFPTSKTIVNMVVAPTHSQNKNVLEAADRIYIDKELMLQLIELYEVLGDTIRRLKEKEVCQTCPPCLEAAPVSNTSSRKSAACETTSTEIVHPAPRKVEATVSCGPGLYLVYLSKVSNSCVKLRLHSCITGVKRMTA